MKRIRPVSCALLSMLMVLSLAVPVFARDADNKYETTVLFTHDLHSHFLPQPSEDGGESGGYARLKTALDRERDRHPDALTLDGGDVSIGSLIQTLYTQQAAELRTMGAMGYDATTAGNHEFDHTGIGFAKMLNAATLSGDPVPAMLMCNYRPSDDNPYQLDIQRAMAAYGVKDHMVLERGGVTYGIFGLMGKDSHSCAPTSGFELQDLVSNAQRCVDELEEQGAQFIICVSHTGTNEKKKLSEDEMVAEKVKGIDLIISGHTHTTLPEPIVVGDTYIVSAGPYCQNLGSITLSWDAETGEKTLDEYKLIPIDETLPDDPEIAALVDSWKNQVDGSYLSRYGWTYDQVLTNSTFDLKNPNLGVQEGNNLGEIVADSYLWAVRNLEFEAPDIPTVAVVGDGVLRAPLLTGPITVSNAFDVLSMGVGSDGTSGFPLVGCYFTGKELKAAAEVDASVTPIMPAAQLFFSGMTHSFNMHRMFFNRVTDVQLEDAPFVNGFNGERNLTEIEDDQLYRVITGMYSAQMLGTVKSSSMGLLSLEPKMADGTPVTDFETCILRDQNGNEIKEWYALAAYLESFGGDGIPSTYAAADGRKDVSHSWSPVQMVKNLNWISLVTMAVLILVVVLAVVLVRHFLYAGKRRRYGSSKRYRG